MKILDKLLVVLLVGCAFLLGYTVGSGRSTQAQGSAYEQGLADGAMLAIDKFRPDLHDAACAQYALGAAKQCKGHSEGTKADVN